MTSLKGDLRSIMGTPFGGVGHAVLIFSRVTRAAFNSDSVVLQLHDRIEMPEEADGKFQVDGLDPGPIRVELEGGTVHNHGWNIDLPDEGTWSLADLVDAQVDWSPAVIGRAEAAAREARDHADRAEAGADRVGTAEQVGTWASEAGASASDAASARSGAVTARDAAQSARDAAEGHANRAATSESSAATSETNAKQSETNAGDYAAVATTAATEAVDAMEQAGFTVDEAVGFLEGQLGESYARRDYVDEYLSELKIENLEDLHLDDVRTPGRYTQIFTNKAIASKGYPVTGVRVNLFVYPINANSSSQVMQTLVVHDTGDIYVRSYVSSWNVWKKSNSGVLNLGTTHLDDALTPGYYAQPLAGNVTKDKGYPVEGTRITLKVERIHETIASQVVQTVTSIRTGETFVRTVISGNYSEWSEVGGGAFYRGAIPSGTTSIDELSPGNWGSGNAHLASELGLPESFGTLLVMYITSGKTFLYQAQENSGQEGALWICSRTGSGSFSSWKKVGGGNGGGVESSTPAGDLFTLDADGLNVEFVAPEQPADTTFVSASSADVHGMYDQLMADNPDYITRSQIGTSSDGTSPIYAYAFKRPEVPGGNDGNPDPAQSRDLPLGVIFSATHGHETASVANIYAFAKMLCDDWQDHPALDVIRWNCEIIIVPMVNAYGWDGRGSSQVYSRKNANEVDVNRNFPRGWVRTTPGTATWSGEEPLSEPESQAIWGLLNEVKGRAVFGIDSHNFSSNENSKWRQIWEIYSHPMTMEVGKSIVQLMSRRWKERYTWIDVPEPYYGYVQVGAGGTLAQGMAELGIPGSTLETNNLTYLDNSGDDYSSRAMTLGLDTIVNHIRLAFREGIRRRSYPRVGEVGAVSASVLGDGEGNVEHE